MSLSEKLEAARVALGKRKERELQSSQQQQQLGPAAAEAELSTTNNRLLAGNLAHEFLTHGTLLGRRIDPTRQPEPEPEPKRRYAQVCCLLMAADGAHIPGVVNPTQLARWLHIKD